jgi:hypothetical protein
MLKKGGGKRIELAAEISLLTVGLLGGGMDGWWMRQQH